MTKGYFFVPAVIAGDILTKRYFHQEATDHYVVRNVWVGVIVGVGILAIVSRLNPKFLPAALLSVTGMFLNIIDSLDGVVVNPFALGIGDIAVVFNLADVTLVVAFIWVLLGNISRPKESLL